MKTRMWDLARVALDRPCPECGAEPLAKCTSLARGKEDRTTGESHPARYPGGNRKISDPANAAALKEARMNPKAPEHRCGHSCRCPVDGLPLWYAPSTGEHACFDPECIYAHGIPENVELGGNVGLGSEPFKSWFQSWSFTHAEQNPGHRTVSKLNEPDRCETCDEKSPAIILVEEPWASANRDNLRRATTNPEDL